MALIWSVASEGHPGQGCAQLEHDMEIDSAVRT